MKRLIITLAILLFAGTAYADTATVLQGTKVEGWLAYENNGVLQVVGPEGQYGAGTTGNGRTWLYVPRSTEEDSTLITIQHDDE